MHKNFKLFLISLTTLSFSAFIWAIINILFLEKLPINYNYIEKNNNFYNIRIDKLFTNETTKSLKPKQNIQTLKGINLKAVFENGNNSFIIIDDKQDIFLDLNQKYKGYKLIKVKKDSAIFEKNNKKFEIKLSKIKFNISKTTNDIIKEISKETLTHYISNPTNIWKNIAISHTTLGYKVHYIKKGSIFEKLGLKKGDYILEVNNKKLNTDSDAWQIYKNIKNFDEINLKIKRNNQIKELNYEIY